LLKAFDLDEINGFFKKRDGRLVNFLQRFSKTSQTLRVTDHMKGIDLGLGMGSLNKITYKITYSNHL